MAFSTVSAAIDTFCLNPADVIWLSSLTVRAIDEIGSMRASVRGATPRCRCRNPDLPLLDDGRELFPHHLPHVRKVFSHGAAREILLYSAWVLP